MENAKFRMPTAYTILFLLIILVAVATWLIPAGAYEYIDGVPVAGSYHEIAAYIFLGFAEILQHLNSLASLLQQRQLRIHYLYVFQNGSQNINAENRCQDIAANPSRCVLSERNGHKHNAHYA